MIREFTLEAPKDYATAENARKAVAKKFGARMDDTTHGENIRFIIMQGENGRFFPVFIGQSALSGGMHFHFNVVA